MKIKRNFHQTAAVAWVLSTALNAGPLVAAATKPDAWFKLWLLTVSVAGLILASPALVRAPVLRRHLCWTDAWSEQERSLIAEGNAKAYWDAAYRGHYVARLLPYAKRLGIVFVVSQVLLEEMQHLAPENVAVQTVNIALSFYGLGVLIAVLLSLPLPYIFRRKRR